MSVKGVVVGVGVGIDEGTGVEVEIVPTAFCNAAAASILPEPYWLSRPGVPKSLAVDSIISITCCRDKSGFADKISAASAATCGEENEVPVQFE